jgi:hypothetical protein
VTAPDAVPPGVSVDELADALRRGAEGDRACEAAVELLAGHRHWLRREPFRALVAWCPADDVYPAAAAVGWPAIEQLLASGLPDTGAERAVLGVAVSLAIGPLYEAASSCDEHNRRLIAAAVDGAMGDLW